MNTTARSQSASKKGAGPQRVGHANRQAGRQAPRQGRGARQQARGGEHVPEQLTGPRRQGRTPADPGSDARGTGNTVRHRPKVSTLGARANGAKAIKIKKGAPKRGKRETPPVLVSTHKIHTNANAHSPRTSRARRTYSHHTGRGRGIQASARRAKRAKSRKHSKHTANPCAANSFVRGKSCSH